MFDTSKKATEKKTTNGLMIGLIACMGVIIVLLGAVVVLLLGRGNDTVVEKEEGPKRNVVVNEENIEEVLENLKEEDKVRPGRYQVTMNSTWRFEDGSSPSENAYVENVATNTNDVYFDLALADTGEVILESPVIPIGSYMKNISLDKDLEPGTYECVLTYHLIDEDQNTLSTLSMSVTVVING